MVAALQNLQLSRSTVYGLFIIAAILMFYAWDALNDAGSAVRQAKAAAIAQKLESELPEGEDEWRRRRDDARAALEAWQGQLWSGETAGIAAASVEQFLATTCEDAGANCRRIEVSPEPIPLQQGVIGIQFSFSGNTNKPAFVTFFAALSAATPKTFISEVDISSPSGVDIRFDIVGVAPVRLTPAADAAPASEGSTQDD